MEICLVVLLFIPYLFLKYYLTDHETRAEKDVHLALHEFRDAFREFDKAVWFFRNENPEAIRLRGVARLRMQQFVQSERDFMRAMQLGDEDARFILSQAPFYKVEFSW